MKIRSLLFAISFFASLNAQIKHTPVKFEKSLANLDSFNNYIENLHNRKLLIKDSILNYVTTFVSEPEWIRKNSLLNSTLSTNALLEIHNAAKIQYDWHYNRFNKNVEDFFKSILVLDQKYRWDLQNCIIKTKNKDSCWKAYPMVTSIDSSNILSIDSFIQLYGYPKQNWAGDGLSSFTIVYYHHNVNNLKNDISLIEKAYNQKFLKKRTFISLYDTYLLTTCQNQKYKSWDCFSKKQNKTVPCTPCLMNREKCNCKEDEE